jgi:propanediol dehydratase large subunit
MSVGSVARGNLRTLKRERATKALSAVRRSLGLLRFTREKVANVTRATCNFEQNYVHRRKLKGEEVRVKREVFRRVSYYKWNTIPSK